MEVVKGSLYGRKKITQAEQDLSASSGRTGGGHCLWFWVFFKENVTSDQSANIQNANREMLFTK